MISGCTKSIGSDCIRSAPRGCPVRHSCNALAASPAKRPYRRQELLPLGPSSAFGHIPFSFSLSLCVFVSLCLCAFARNREILAQRRQDTKTKREARKAGMCAYQTAHANAHHTPTDRP